LPNRTDRKLTGFIIFSTFAHPDFGFPSSESHADGKDFATVKYSPDGLPFP